MKNLIFAGLLLIVASCGQEKTETNSTTEATSNTDSLTTSNASQNVVVDTTKIEK
jgi:hypothetical protein